MAGAALRDTFCAINVAPTQRVSGDHHVIRDGSAMVGSATVLMADHAALVAPYTENPSETRRYTPTACAVEIALLAHSINN
jgi:hypothetical protein